MKDKSAAQSVVIGLFIVLAFAAYGSPAWANSTYWTGATSGNWFGLVAVLGTLAPTGTLPINGNLRLLEEATTLATVTSQAQDKVNVSGTSGTMELNGRLVVILSGTFSPNLECVARFTLLHADGGRGVSQFASVSIQDTTLNAPYTPQITYDANNVYLDLVFSNCE